jgi:Kef-type K+ transport system membrane component KefB
MLFPVKWALGWFIRKTGSLENGTPTPLIMVTILMVIFFSAFMTDVLGVHAIFGGAWYSIPLFY